MERLLCLQGERFKLNHRVYDRQYAQIYFQRLMMLKPKLLQQVKKLWPGVAVCGILNLPENDDVAVLGTVYKDMKLKPSILDEYVKDRGAAQLVGHAKFVGADDALILEDESARMSLRGDKLPVGDLVTGVVMAVRGAAVPGGDFIVREWCFVGLPSQPPRPSLSEDKYIAFVSGLEVGNDAADPLRLSLVVDYLTGLLGSGEEQKLIAKIARVVIAGGLLQSTESLSQATTHSKQKQQAAALAPVKEVDLCMTELASAIPVDMMPGQTDPANQSLPQQAMHACLLPGACQVTNPHAFSVDGVHFVGTSGQNVDDIHRYSAMEDRLAIMQSVLQWGHLVPTAPDTLTCYPFQQDDPFILEQAPHVFYVGNQPEFSAKIFKGNAGQSVLLISVPRFADSGILVLLNVRTLAVQPLQFDSQLN
eukprot:jgi/Astpho2/2214/e_gw1.00040.61.1_t